MYNFELIVEVERFNGVKTVREFQPRTVSLPSRADEITLKNWSDWHMMRKDAPVWFNEIQTKTADEQNEIILQWDESKWFQYIVHIAKEISIFCSESLEFLVAGSTPDDDESAGLLAMYRLVLENVATYTPKMRDRFTHKGQTFIVPPSIVDNWGNKTPGAKIKTIEAIEALQVEHVYTGKDENGNFLIDNHKYHTDLALVAVLCRKINKDGTLEKMPLDFIERRKFIDRRMKFFEDVPMPVALDVDFFLRNSKIRSIRTRTLRRYSRGHQRKDKKMQNE